MYRIFFCCLLFFTFLCTQSCSGPNCRSARDCPPKKFCSSEGFCVQDCEQDKDCGKDQSCSLQGRCIDNEQKESKPSDANNPKEHEPKEQEPKEQESKEKAPENPPRDCQDGQEKACSTGDTKLHGIGVCKHGKQVCSNGQWGGCIDEVKASTEVCDKKDNDCDGQVDEGLEGCNCVVNSDCPPETPSCQAGQCIRFCQTNNDCQRTSYCKQGYCQQCIEGSRSSLEVCNGKDDDCDGQMDEGLSQACGTDKGTCRKGTQVCVQGVWDKCVGNIEPKEETCNNRDDNCNGQIDEYLTQACGNSDLGECKKGTQVCKAGVWQRCQGNIEPTTEVCNNKDDNCDGKVDNNITRPCGSDVGECKEGFKTCTAGTWSACQGDTKPTTEVCNGKDDDCDGLIDENLHKVCGSSDVGACKKGKSVCERGSWKACVGNIEPLREVCDGFDNDCDGKTDENIIGCGCKQDQECPANKPKCLSGVCVKYCVDSSECLGDEFCYRGYCKLCTKADPSIQEVCNGRDDNCNGQVDEHLTRVCGSFIGSCQQGKQTCTSGSWSACKGEIPPGTEICNRIDDDCDGKVDEAPLDCFNASKLKTRLRGHIGYQIYSALFTSDGLNIVTAASNRSIQFWDVKTGHRHRFFGTTAKPYRATLNADNRKLAFSNWPYKTIHIVDVKTGKEEKTLTGHTGNVTDCIFSPDGNLLASGGSDRKIMLWELPSGKLLTTLTGHSGNIERLAFNHDGTLLASADRNRIVKIWDVKTKKHLKDLRGHNSEVKAVIFTPDGKTLISAGKDDRVRTWNPTSGGGITVFSRASPMNDLAISPNGKYLAGAGLDGKVYVWKLPSGVLLKVLSGHTRSVLHVNFSPDGQSIVSASDDGYFRVWKQP